jgi:hypothetical protein
VLGTYHQPADKPARQEEERGHAARTTNDVRYDTCCTITVARAIGTAGTAKREQEEERRRTVGTSVTLEGSLGTLYVYDLYQRLSLAPKHRQAQ